MLPSSLAIYLLSLLAFVNAAPCDLYASGGTPCVAAHATTRALFDSFIGSLYQLKRGSDNATLNIAPLSAGGVANAAAQDSFCNGTTCLITIIYDQTGRGNHLTQAPPGGAAQGPEAKGLDSLAAGGGAPVTLNGRKAYGVFIPPGTGYRNDATNGIAVGDAAEGIYAVLDGTHYNDQCCFDYGNAETNAQDTGNGHMETIYFGTAGGSGAGSGPWVMADLENGLFSGQNRNSNPGDKTISSRFITAIVKGQPNNWAIKAGNAQSGTLTTMWSGPRPTDGYNPMKKEGAILLGVGGDNSNWAQGTFYEGAMTSGFPTDAVENAVQANIIGAGYATTSLVSGPAMSVGSIVSLRATTACCSNRYIAHSGSTISTQAVSSSDSIATRQSASWLVVSALSATAASTPGTYYLSNVRPVRYYIVPSTSGAGKYHLTPLKARDGRMKRVIQPTKSQAVRRAALRSQLALLLQGDSISDGPQTLGSTSEEPGGDQWVDEMPTDSLPVPYFEPVQVPLPPRRAAVSRFNLADAWGNLLPALEGPWSQFKQATYASPPTHIGPSLHHECQHACDTYINKSVDCLYPTLGPASKRPDPFRRSLTQAVLWSSNLRDRIALRWRRYLPFECLRRRLKCPQCPLLLPSVPPSDASTSASTAPTDAAPVPSNASATASNDASGHVLPASGTAHHADRLLHDRCPLCFGGVDWGKPLSSGGDVQLGGDACFSYRHLRSAGDGPIGYKPQYFVSKAKVEQVRRRVDEAKRRRPTQTLDDSCAENWTAANEKKKLVDPKRYDASGIFALICRHGQTLFCCNIDTPGEQHYYIIALLEEVIQLLPPDATISQAYDVGCVIDRSQYLFDVLGTGVRERIKFVLNAMHAYGHEWRCQLQTHVASGPLTSILPLSTQTVSTAWVTGYFGNNPKMFGRYYDAGNLLRRCGIPISDLRDEWAAQKAAQTSGRSHAPKRLRRDLDKVVALQAQIDAIEKSLGDVRESISNQTASNDSFRLLRELQATHADLERQAEALYSSLNIHQIYPALEGLPPELARLSCYYA
ncbi:Alpha-L-arabinofuranosidase B domain protein [Mycena indigotica]|uniref:Alpha-L-arabinofuranosidase n=1 Tax=Mycena indigotica TaxID=2126181 RepID=A0A8H6VYD7_9AGAR|nr:Alpha-L-arabinofuranosidase B domain protein [Mycena indigotica]KAF7292704.1 Alpha-L-arabinofuranosidase B domain protein [Mycena indigotica]